MRHPPDLQPGKVHRPLYPEPESRGPNILFAFVPAGAIVVASLAGVLFGKLVPTNEAVGLGASWGPTVATVLMALTALIVIRCHAPIVEDIVPRPLLQLGVVALAGWTAWLASPFFITHGLPALLADRGEHVETTVVVDVLATDPVCAAFRSGESRLFGAIVRSDHLGGPSGSRICRIPRAVWEGLEAGDQLILHGYQGRLAFHYARISLAERP